MLKFNLLAVGILLAGCGMVSEKYSEFRNVKIEYLTKNESADCSGGRFTLLAVEARNEKKEIVKGSPFYIAPGTYTLLYRPEFETMVNGECHVFEEVSTGGVYGTQKKIIAVERGKSYRLSVSKEKGVELNPL